MHKAKEIIQLLESVIGVTDNPLDLSGYVQGRYITFDALTDDPKYYEILSVGPKTILARDPDSPSDHYNFPIEKTAIVDLESPYTKNEIDRFKVGPSTVSGTANLPKGSKDAQDWHNRNHFSGDLDLGTAGTRTPRDKVNQLRSMRPGLSKLQPKNKRSLITVRDNS
jgi:hypothetical protein